MMNKISKEDHAALTRALTMYERSTGERVTHLANEIGIKDDAADAKAENERKTKEYNDKARLQTEIENTQMKAREAKRAATDIQPGNPGPGEPALATERAEAADPSLKLKHGVNAEKP